jgi:transposase
MKEKTTTAAAGVKRRKYDASFREEVLRMISSGRPVREVAQSLGIGENLIYKWRSRSTTTSSQQPATVGKGNSPFIPKPEEGQELLRRIGDLETERDILKKALAIFSRQT